MNSMLRFGNDTVVVECPKGMTIGTQEWLDFMVEYFWNEFCSRTDEPGVHQYFVWVALMHMGFWETMDPWEPT